MFIIFYSICIRANDDQMISSPYFNTTIPSNKEDICTKFDFNITEKDYNEIVKFISSIKQQNLVLAHYIIHNKYNSGKAVPDYNLILLSLLAKCFYIENSIAKNEENELFLADYRLNVFYETLVGIFIWLEKKDLDGYNNIGDCGYKTFMNLYCYEETEFIEFLNEIIFTQSPFFFAGVLLSVDLTGSFNKEKVLLKSKQLLIKLEIPNNKNIFYSELYSDKIRKPAIIDIDFKSIFTDTFSFDFEATRLNTESQFMLKSQMLLFCKNQTQLLFDSEEATQEKILRLFLSYQNCKKSISESKLYSFLDTILINHDLLKAESMPCYTFIQLISLTDYTHSLKNEFADYIISNNFNVVSAYLHLILLQEYGIVSTAVSFDCLYVRYKQLYTSLIIYSFNDIERSKIVEFKCFYESDFLLFFILIKTYAFHKGINSFKADFVNNECIRLKSKYLDIIIKLSKTKKYALRPMKYENIKEFIKLNLVYPICKLWNTSLFDRGVSLADIDYKFEEMEIDDYYYRKIEKTSRCNVN